MKRAGSLAALLLTLLCAAPACAWDKPIRLADTASTFPRIDRHGTVRVLQSTRRHRVEAALLPWGKRHFRHCGVPGVKRDTKFLHSAYSDNEAGAMLYGWSTQAKHSPFRIASAAPGRCFRRHTVVQRAVPQKQTSIFAVLLGPLGTMVATGYFYDKPGPFFAAGPIGGTLRRRGHRKPPRPGAQATAQTVFVTGDRLLSTYALKKRLPGEGGRYREEVWSVLGGPRGGPPRKTRKIAQITGHDEPNYPDSDATIAHLDFVTDRRGGQVAGGFSGGGFTLLSRRPGRAFGRARVFSGSSLLKLVESAGNGRGDAVFAWESGYDDLYALVRRRNGKVVGPTLLSPGDNPRYAGRPSVGIDSAGRAIVAYKAQGAELSQLVPNQILVAVTGRRGGFRAPRSITGPPDTINDFPMVAVNARGQAAITFDRETPASDGINLDSHNLVVRGRLGR